MRKDNYSTVQSLVLHGLVVVTRDHMRNLKLEPIILVAIRKRTLKTGLK